MKLEVGQQAPDFTLRDSDKNEVKLSDNLGKNVVLLFFPAAFTSVCTAELCNVRDNYDQYGDLEAQVYGISVDMPFSLAEFRKQQNLQFPLLSDFNKDVSQGYGAFYEDFVMGLKGVSKRAAFVVDREGKIAYAEVLENAGEQPDFEKIHEVLEGLKAGY